MRLNLPLRVWFTALFAVFALVLSACSSSISEEEFVDKLVDSGLDEPTATCITDGIQAAGIDLNDVTDEALGDDDPPQEVLDVTFECVLAASDADG